MKFVSRTTPYPPLHAGARPKITGPVLSSLHGERQPANMHQRTPSSPTIASASRAGRPFCSVVLSALKGDLKCRNRPARCGCFFHCFIRTINNSERAVLKRQLSLSPEVRTDMAIEEETPSEKKRPRFRSRSTRFGDVQRFIPTVGDFQLCPQLFCVASSVELGEPDAKIVERVARRGVP